MGTDRHTDRQTTNDFLGLLSEPKKKNFDFFFLFPVVKYSPVSIGER